MGVKIIYMQDTINYMHKLDPNLLEGLNIYGVPEVKVITDEEGNTKQQYYLYQEKS